MINLTNQKPMHKTPKEICLYLKEQAAKQGITDSEIAVLMNMERENINSIMNGKRNITLRNLLKLIDILNLQISFIPKQNGRTE